MDDSMMEIPSVSIIIPTYDSIQTFERCLKSIFSQDYSSVEVVVVDNFSSDGTPKIAKKFGVRVIQKKSTPALARNIGVDNSSGEFVFFVDSDQVLSTSLVSECVNICRLEGADMIRIPEVFFGKGFWGSCSALWKNHYSRIEHVSIFKKALAVGEPRFFARETLAWGGMCNPELLWGEDHDLHERLANRKAKEAVSKSTLYHYEPNSTREIMIRNLRYGKSLSTFMRHSRRNTMASFVMRTLLTLGEVLGEIDKKPIEVAGCIFLFGLKTLAMSAGFIVS